MTTQEITKGDPDGANIGRSGESISFFGATPVGQRADASQVAITDNGTGTVSDTIAAGVGIHSICLPISDFSETGAGALGSTTTGDIVTDYVPGFKFKVLNLDFITDVPGTGASASAPCQVEIGAVAVTGALCTITLASTSAKGELTAGTLGTAANTGSATDTISIVKATSVVFTAGAGYFLLSLQNMDTADALASIADKSNEIRTTLVNFGLITGAA
ncbi:MAG: hypothetical protein V3R25_09180 [Nitrosomonadaceae bacterium]